MLTSDVHFKADVVKKEEELSFSVDVKEKERLHANFIFLRGLNCSKRIKTFFALTDGQLKKRVRH